MRYAVLAVAALAVATPIAAQESANFKLNEHTFNAGGHPVQGTVFTSTNFRVTLDAIGDAVLAPALASPSFRSEAAFVAAYPPPGEVASLVFNDKTTLAWGGERAAVRFNLYRDPLSTLPGNFGSCLQSSLPSRTATDPATPLAGLPWFYLVTGENRLYEEGTKGYRSGGLERPNPVPCP